MAKRRASTIPAYRRKRPVSWVRRISGWVAALLLGFLAVSVAWVLVYRVVNPPLTATMIGDMIAGPGATRDWMPIDDIDRDMVRAAIAAEDGKFCSHHGFDVQAIENAVKRNASGGRIRGGSTISQQAAKNAFLWQGGGYARKGIEAWFTLLIEHLWGKRRIMEVYLNLAETGIGTYGVNAGSLRYFGHDASAMSAGEAARIAAVLPLPKKRGAITPTGFTRRYGNIIAARIPVVARDGLDACIYKGQVARSNKSPPPVEKKSRPIPGAEFENQRAAPSEPAPRPTGSDTDVAPSSSGETAQPEPGNAE